MHDNLGTFLVCASLAAGLAVGDLEAAMQHAQKPKAETVPAAPVGETRAVAEPDTSVFSAVNLVVSLEPGDDEPVELLPDLEELSDLTGLDAEPERVKLGRMLFHDTRLSHDFTISCASCHDLRFGGTDRHRTAVGIRGQVGPVNTPTVFNSALQVAQFWDGRAGDLQQQAAGPPEASGEMGSSFAEIVARVQQDGAYEKAFRQAFPERVESSKSISKELILEAIATFELTLVTPDSPFDRWLAGDGKLGRRELRGYALFKEVGCSECHYGAAIGGKTYQVMGRKVGYFAPKRVTHADMGRFNVTKDQRDRHAFKVPMLRNVAETAPYFHDGSVATLEEAVELMALHQLGYELKRRDRDDLVAFLRSLTGTYKGRSLRQGQVSPPKPKAPAAKQGGRK